MTRPDNNALPRPRVETLLLAVISGVLVCMALQAAQMVFLPIVLASFLAVLVQPPVVFLQRYLPKWLSLVLMLLVVAAGFVGVWAFFAVSATALAQRGPAYVERFVEIVEHLLHRVEPLGLPTDVADVPLAGVAQWSLQLIGASLVPIMTTMGVATLVAFMLALLLAEMESFREKLRRGLRDEDSAEFFAGAHAVTRNFQNFFVVKTGISLATGVCTALFTYAVGIDFPFIWGTVAFLLNYIPSIGSMIAVWPTPIERAASTKGRSRSAMICPRTIRAMVSHEIAPNAPKSERRRSWSARAGSRTAASSSRRSRPARRSGSGSRRSFSHSRM